MTYLRLIANLKSENIKLKAEKEKLQKRCETFKIMLGVLDRELKQCQKTKGVKS